MAKKIKLTQGKHAIVDDEDFERLSQYKWYYHHEGYAVRNSKENMRRRLISMHRIINNTPDGKVTDHINGDKLDNRKSNLRSCTHAENARNSKLRSDSSSGMKGVYKIIKKSKYTYWCGRVTGVRNGKQKVLCIKHFPFTDEGKLQAAKWYNEQVKIHFREFAKLNEV